MLRSGSVGLAITISLLAIVQFDLMGLIIKRLSSSYGAAELAAWRNIVGILPSVLVLWTSRNWRRGGRPLAIRQWRLACLRGAVVSLAQFTFYASLGLMAFATTTTISYSTAIFTTALAVPLLGERVGPARWGAVLIGFVGVVMVMGFGGGFGWEALLPLAAACLYAVSAVTARMIDAEVPSALVNLYSAGTAAICTVVLALGTGGFSPIDSGADFAWLLGMGGIGGSAVLFMIVAYRMTEQSNLAPFSYFGIPTAFTLGWLFYGEAPVDDLFPGALLIVLGGLLIVWRERRRSKLRPVTRTPPSGGSATPR